MANPIILRNKISEGLASWLTFENHCGREKLFNERYISLPLGQILINNFEGVIEGEVNHPVLTSSGRRGRPPQMDFVVRNKGKVKLVVESKWAGATGITVADILWDCVRLELAAHHYGCEALFILAGQRARIDALLNSKTYNPKTSRNKPSPILGVNGNGRISVNIESPKRDYCKALHKILKSYPTIKFPRSFVCGSGTCIPRTVSKDTYASVVWHIRPEFPPKHFTFQVK